MSIPRIIHQTAPTKILSDNYKNFQKQLIDLHSDWEYCFYDDKECRQFIQTYMPDMLDIYDTYKTNVQRADLFRVLAVYIRGGFYADMDVVCHKSLDALCFFDMVFAGEKTLTEEDRMRCGNRDALRIANYMFGCSPRHPFLAEVLKRMVKEADRSIVTENDILESTGPGLLSTAYHDCKDEYSIHVLENKNIFCEECKTISCQFGEYATHLHDGNWRWQRKKKKRGVVRFLSKVFLKIKKEVGL